jgi:hypothetical protein
MAWTFSLKLLPHRRVVGKPLKAGVCKRQGVKAQSFARILLVAYLKIPVADKLHSKLAT